MFVGNKRKGGQILRSTGKDIKIQIQFSLQWLAQKREGKNIYQYVCQERYFCLKIPSPKEVAIPTDYLHIDTSCSIKSVKSLMYSCYESDC